MMHMRDEDELLQILRRIYAGLGGGVPRLRRAEGGEQKACGEEKNFCRRVRRGLGLSLGHGSGGREHERRIEVFVQEGRQDLRRGEPLERRRNRLKDAQRYRRQGRIQI